MAKMKIVGILVEDRASRAPAVQEVITRFGTDISCRLGIPGPDKENGLIVLAMEDDKGIRDELAGIKGVEVKSLEF